jgi:hypothetical protein
MTTIPPCDICCLPQDEPGALVFGPPWPLSNIVVKWHVCVNCFDLKLLDMLRSASLSELP